MNLKKLMARIKGGEGDNRLYRVVVVFLAAICLLQTIRLMQSNERIIVVPPELNGKAEISYNSANSEYKESVALFLADLLGNITPDNVDFVKGAVGPFLDPTIYSDVMRDIERQAREIKLERVSNSFKPKKLFTENETGRQFVFGTGVLEGVSGNAERSDQSYEFEIKVRRFRPLVTAVDTYRGEPRTKEVLERMKNQEIQRAERERGRASR